MNNPTRNILTGLLVMGTLVTSLHSQAPATGDPFVKDAAAANARKDQPWQNVLVVLEVYALDRTEAAGLLEAESGGAARYRRVVDLSKNGKARLDTLTAVNGKSGIRVVTESIDEVRFATEFGNPALSTSPASGRSWETRNAGDTLELEAVIAPDQKSCSINLVPMRVALKEFSDQAGPAGNDDKVSVAQFVSEKLVTSVWVQENETFYLGTVSPSTGWGDEPKPQAPAETRLAFIRVSFTGPTADEIKPAAKPSTDRSLSLEYTWYSMERAQGRDFLATGSTMNGPWEAMQALLKEKKARLEHVTTLNTTSGQRAAAEEATELRYPTEYIGDTIRPTGVDTTVRTVKGAKGTADATEQTTVYRQEAKGTRQPGYASAFETRTVGLTLEVEPVLGSDGVSVDLNQVIHGVTYQGTLKVGGVGAAYAPQPLFESRKITNSHGLILGRHILVGTFNPPCANGVNERRDTGRTWVVFVRALNEP